MKEKNIDCLNCPHVLTINLHWNDPINSKRKGERLIQRDHIENRKSRIVLHNSFAAVGTLWNIWKKTAKERILERLRLIHTFLFLAISDIKGSCYLALSGRYREALVILRTVLDNLIIGNYFHSSEEEAETEEEKAEVDIEFQAWQIGKTRCFPGFNEAVNKTKFLTNSTKKGLKQSYSRLSNIVHTWRLSEVEKGIEDVPHPIPHAFSSTFDFEDLVKWYKEIQNTFGYLFEILSYWLRKIEIEGLVENELEKLEKFANNRGKIKPLFQIECELLQ